MTWTLHQGDCLDILPTLPDQSIDVILTDPPYAEVDRAYGRLTEADWHTLMDQVVTQAKRLLKPSGSAVFILQPNSRHIGTMRLWIWEFLLRTARSWNLVQNVYWWNCTALPSAGCERTRGLLRNSVKYCLWFGSPKCYRNQESVLWDSPDLGHKYEDRALKYRPSGFSVRDGRLRQTAKDRGGSTPFNLIPLSNGNTGQDASAFGHGARTPYKLAEWWTRYVCPVGGTILDPFNGAGTMGLAALAHGADYVGIERVQEYCDLTRERLTTE